MILRHRLFWPIAALVLAVVLGFVMDRLAALRRPGGERGDYWTRVALVLCLGPGLLSLLSGWLPSLSAVFWQRGLHLQPDLVRGLSLPRTYLTALLLPFAVWSLSLGVLLVLRPGDRESGRWLAGRLGELRRRWVLACALPLVLALGFGYQRLGVGPEGYPAATWSTTALLTLTLAFVAASAGRAPLVARAAPHAATTAPRALRPWPEALADRGIALRRLLSWPASPPPRPVQGAAASDLADRLLAMGARGVAPEMMEAAARILDPPPGRSPVCLVFGPDDCGQVEAVGVAAGDVAQRFNETTLLIVPREADSLVRRLSRWLPEGCRAAAVSAAGAPPAQAAVWVVDAETLSEKFLRRLANDRLGPRIGFVVWWDVHRYTGVLAANLWAVSRRLDRLLRAQGRTDARLLVLVRSAEHGDAQLPRFVRHLLPYDLPGNCEVHVERRAPRPVELHLLRGHAAFFQNGGGNIPELGRHPSLVAALASVEEGWPTCLERPRDVTDFELNAVTQLPAGGALLGTLLLDSAAQASVRLGELEAGDILSLTALISQTGRGAPEGLTSYCGLTLSANPYAEYLLGRLSEASDVRRRLPGSRRLVGAAGNARIVRRHLLMALAEHRDTLSGLLSTFRWEKQLILDTLEQISSENRLDRSREVRFLTGEGELEIERLYESLLPSETEKARPLDTLGSRLVEVRDVAAGGEDGGARMRVDPERLTIQAYPGCVFARGGQRYQIPTWSSREDVVRRGWLECERQGYARTWRVRSPLVYRLQEPGPEVVVDPEGRLLWRFTVDLTYSEEVTHVLRLEPDLTTGAERWQRTRLVHPVTSDFVTRALILRTVSAPQPEELEALCLALRYVLPVHLGVEEDALEVVPLGVGREHRIAGSPPIYGVAIVDLYPGGIGLADAITEDASLLLRLLEWTRDWLADPSASADTALLGSPLARATLGDDRPSPGAALALLQRLIGPGES